MTHPDRARRLARMKAIALGCLLGAVALLALAHLNGREGVWAWVGAFAEAATVGALADWFAVVALFRHPLGLPIPHTAIIPHNKQRIAEALADFLVNNFLSHEQLLKRLDAWNPARQLGLLLGDETRLDALAQQLREWAAHALTALDTPTFEREVLGLMHRQLSSWDAAATAARLTRALTAGQHHQRVLNAGLEQVADWLDKPEVRLFITEKLVTMARREFPKFTWLTDKFDYTDALGVALSEKLANALLDEVRAVLNEPGHPLRQRYAAEAMRLLERLEEDPDFRARVDEWKRRFVESQPVRDYARDLWARLRGWLHEDLAREDSASFAQLRAWAGRLGARLRDDPLWQTTANAQLRIAAEHLADQLRKLAPGYIRQTVDAWDTRQMVREIEISVGRDLQFIRLNGTLIGGLAGLTLHALFRLPIFH
ncbi:DUF445 domain-containing protein [Lysobacter pythonis]|uniref:DUF445 domain-containing protein n=1 Tax=Solilutibacter pythonis TaxID=2483112 RepID=A0A3M2I8J8_9GAMM|nr:DUF445 domain-containing protein [Lysobacter pythonis]RMH94807.1 DUF445 domain-containing protein [Lysobacter pythonis]